jgi:hypothetical protein
MKRTLIAGLATAALVLAGLGLGAGVAQADPTPGTKTWCPGQPMPKQDASLPPLNWDMTVCHDWYYWGATFNPIEGEYPVQLRGML